MNNYSPFSLILDTVQSANDRVRRPAEMVTILERFFFRMFLMYRGEFERIWLTVTVMTLNLISRKETKPCW